MPTTDALKALEADDLSPSAPDCAGSAGTINDPDEDRLVQRHRALLDIEQAAERLRSVQTKQSGAALDCRPATRQRALERAVDQLVEAETTAVDGKGAAQSIGRTRERAAGDQRSAAVAVRPGEGDRAAAALCHPAAS
jgi:hypothetical protein